MVSSLPTILGWKGLLEAGISKTITAKGSGTSVRVEGNSGKRRPVMFERYRQGARDEMGSVTTGSYNEHRL